ncbi:MAG: hypothetical protein ACTSWA_06530, partial [Candidatus Thorarchaeota archaeon]
MPHDSPSHSCNSKKSKKRLWAFGLVAATSAIWILLRTGSKPSRILYPCQQAAMTNIGVFKIALLAV